MNLKRTVIESLSKGLARVYRNQIVVLPTGGVHKVNIGCGLSVAPGWINVDASLSAWISRRPRWLIRLAYKLSGANRFYTETFYRDTLRNNKFVYHNIDFGLPFRQQTVDYVFSSHFLEHLDKECAQGFLKECLRILKPSGVVRIAVPDLEYAWELYKGGEKELMLHDFFFTGTDTGFSQHRYAYDFELLSKTLSEVGFRTVERKAYREGATPDLELLDNRADYSLYVEARPQ